MIFRTRTLYSCQIQQILRYWKQYSLEQYTSESQSRFISINLSKADTKPFESTIQFKKFQRFMIQKGLTINKHSKEFYLQTQLKRINYANVLDLYRSCLGQQSNLPSQEAQFYRYSYEKCLNFNEVLSIYQLFRNKNKKPDDLMLKIYKHLKKNQLDFGEKIFLLHNFLSQTNRKPRRKVINYYVWTILQKEQMSNESFKFFSREDHYRYTNIILGVLITFFAACLAKPWETWDFFKNYQIQKPHSKKIYPQPSYVKEPTSIKIQMKNLLDQYSKKIKKLLEGEDSNKQQKIQSILQFQLIAGVPGCGKTTSIQQIVQQFQGQIYYFSFKAQDCQADPKILKDKIKYAMQLIHSVSQEKTKKNIPIVILDQINYLSLVQRQDRIDFQMFLNTTYKRCVKVFALSSSSQFYTEAQENQKLNYSFNVLPLVTSHDRKEMLKPIIKIWIQSEKNAGEILGYMQDQRYLPRTALKRLKQVQKFKGKEISELKRLDQQWKESKVDKLKAIFEKYQNFESFNKKGSKIKFTQSIIRKILEENQTLLDNNCRRIRKELKSERGISSQDPKLINFLKDLQEQNLIVFCQPAQKRERSMFQSYLDTQHRINRQ